MNIFYLDRNPKIAAQMHCDKHVVKMVLEYAQILSTAHRVIDGDEVADREGLYEIAHKNHPSTAWQGLAMLIIRGCRTCGRILVMSTRTVMARYTSHLHCTGCTTLPRIFHIEQFCRSLHRRRSVCSINLSVTQTLHLLKIPYLLTGHSTLVTSLGLLNGLIVTYQLGTNNLRQHNARY